MDRFPPEAGEEAVSMLREVYELYKAEIPIGSELADAALEDVAFALHRSGILDDLIRRVTKHI